MSPIDLPRLHCHADRPSCARALAQELAERLRAALSARSRAHLLLAGGQSPQALLGELARAPLDWTRVDISPSDERWVPVEAPQSNLRLLREALPQARLLDPRQAPQPAAAAQAWGAQLAEWQPLDAVLLGMGEDGHFASLFPGMPGLAAALDPAAAPGALCGLAADEPRQRLSANLSLLLRGEWLGLLVFGAAKRRLLEDALADVGDARELPIGALLRQAGRRLQIHWAP